VSNIGAEKSINLVQFLSPFLAIEVRFGKFNETILQHPKRAYSPMVVSRGSVKSTN
jgi:hypothetical protein